MDEQKTSSKRPNVILILADDMGFSDIGCFGSEIQTPNIDSLARDGAAFTQMYNCARCCPTRASLLTGLYPHQAGVGYMVNDLGLPGYQGYLRDDSVTIAEALRAGGYRTYLSGKWHVGGAYNASKPEEWRPGEPGFPIPTQHGFDHFYGFLAGAISYYNPHTLMKDDLFILSEPGTYFTDEVTDYACDAIRESSVSGDSFFIYVGYNAPHWPLHAQPEDIARYEGHYRTGWDVLRTARHEEMKGLGRVNADWDISARDDQAPPWDALDAERQEWESMRMAVYSAMVDRMDQGIGRIMKQLDELDLADDTLIMFLSDNGGCAEFLAEDGHVQQYNLRTHEGRDVAIGNRQDLQPGPSTTFMSYDLPWANVSNAPFREYKHWVHEGGISTPFLVKWPKQIPPGITGHQPCHVVDIMATVLDAAAIPSPVENKGMPVPAPDGESLLDALRGKPWQRSQPVFFEHEGNRAVRDGSWKIVSKYPGDWELYNMDDDRTELNDLSVGSRDKVSGLACQYSHWANTHQVVDWDDLQKIHPDLYK